MDIIIEPNSKDAIYEQIIFKIKIQIASGKLNTGDSLPSIRKLSQSLQVSIISVQRAYNELQKAGIIETVPGKGCFVSAKFDMSFMKEDLLRKVEDSAKKTVEITKTNGISLDKLLSLIEILWES